MATAAQNMERRATRGSKQHQAKKEEVQPLNASTTKELAGGDLYIVP